MKAPESSENSKTFKPKAKILGKYNKSRVAVIADCLSSWCVFDESIDSAKIKKYLNEFSLEAKASALLCQDIEMTLNPVFLELESNIPQGLQKDYAFLFKKIDIFSEEMMEEKDKELKELEELLDNKEEIFSDLAALRSAAIVLKALGRDPYKLIEDCLRINLINNYAIGGIVECPDDWYHGEERSKIVDIFTNSNRSEMLLRTIKSDPKILKDYFIKRQIKTQNERHSVEKISLDDLDIIADIYVAASKGADEHENKSKEKQNIARKLFASKYKDLKKLVGELLGDIPSFLPKSGMAKE